MSVLCTYMSTLVTVLTVSVCVFATSLKVCDVVRSQRGYVFPAHGQMKVAMWK